MSKHSRKCMSHGCDNTAPVGTGRRCKPCGMLLHRYDMTVPERDAMLSQQDFRCKACGSEVEFSSRGGRGKGDAVVDHCHTTNEVRGILCGRCNMTLGMVEDDVTTLSNLITYLEYYDV